MPAQRNSRAMAFIAGVVLLAGCSDAEPTGVPEGGPAAAGPHSLHPAADVVPLALTPFSFRGSLDPYRIQQLPDFMAHSNVRSDLVIQRSIFAPGAGAWHTHPGPSFVYVIQGEIKLEKFTDKDGCVETPVYDAGKVYFEIADEVHRAVVVSAEDAVLLVTRFNIPVGGSITIPAADPGC